MKKTKLDREEKNILRTFNSGEWKTARDKKQTTSGLKKSAASFRKNKRINIRMPEGELLDLKTRAMEEGIPYQTLISSILHKYVTHRLIARRR